MSLLKHNDLSTARYPEAIFVFISEYKSPPGIEVQRELEDSSQDVMTDEYRVMK